MVKISEKLYKDLKPHTPKTPSARPILKIHKNPLKIKLVVNTQNSAVCKICIRHYRNMIYYQKQRTE